MSDIIFSANGKTVGTEREVNTIDWDDFATNYDKYVVASREPGLDDIMRESIASLINDEEDEDNTRVAKKELPDALKEHQFKSKGKAKDEDEDVDESDEDEDEDKNVRRGKGDKEVEASEACACGDCDECLTREKAPKGRKASTRGHKLHFNHPSQISPEALRTAQANGDTELVDAIIEVRKLARNDKAQKAQRLASTLNETNKKVAKRNNYRLTVVSAATKTAETIKKAEAAKPIKTATKAISEKTVTSMKLNEKEIIAQRLMSQGFDKEYVDVFLGLGEPTFSEHEVQIREIGASTISNDTKRVAVSGLLKVAELSAEQVARQEKYWIDELGYDPEWVHDLFSTKY